MQQLLNFVIFHQKTFQIREKQWNKASLDKPAAVGLLAGLGVKATMMVFTNVTKKFWFFKHQTELISQSTGEKWFCLDNSFAVFFTNLEKAAPGNMIPAVAMLVSLFGELICRPKKMNKKEKRFCHEYHHSSQLAEFFKDIKLYE